MTSENGHDGDEHRVLTSEDAVDTDREKQRGQHEEVGNRHLLRSLLVASRDHHSAHEHHAHPMWQTQ